jgi:hypothetical protein
MHGSDGNEFRVLVGKPEEKAVVERNIILKKQW